MSWGTTNRRRATVRRLAAWNVRRFVPHDSSRLDQRNRGDRPDEHSGFERLGKVQRKPGGVRLVGILRSRERGQCDRRKAPRVTPGGFDASHQFIAVDLRKADVAYEHIRGRERETFKCFVGRGCRLHLRTDPFEQRCDHLAPIDFVVDHENADAGERISCST